MDLFDLVLNTDSTKHAFMNRSGNPFVVPPRAAFDHSIINNAQRDYLKPVSNFLSSMEEEKFYLMRTFALGDVLQLVPVVRYLQELKYDCYIRTISSYLSILGKLGVRALSVNHSDDDYGLILDGTVERDHEVRKLQAYHRIDQYLSAIGCDRDKNMIFDWSCDLSKFDAVAEDFVEQPYIVFQGSGSSPRKSLPNESIGAIIKLCNSFGYRVAVVGGNEATVSQKDYDSSMTHIFFKRLSLEQLFWLIGKAQCIVCLDSSPLWISHFTSTPVIAVLGSTRKEQRIVYHPLYPEGAEAVELWKETECAPCFEEAKPCGGSYACLKIKPEILFDLIQIHIERFINV